jgi:hypothetical protein
MRMSAMTAKRDGGNIDALGVMAGLKREARLRAYDPAIHHSSKKSCAEGWMRGPSPRMTLRWDPEINLCGKSACPIPFCSNR